MLYQAIRLGSEIYHDTQPGFVMAYDTALERRLNWDRPVPNEREVTALRRFLNSDFRARMQARVPDIRDALRKVLPLLNGLEGQNMLDVCFEFGRGNLGCVSSRTFHTLARCAGPARGEWTAASKIMGIINSELFVMWDREIRAKKRYEDSSYRNFLIEMQRLAECAIAQTMDQEELSRDAAVQSLRGRDCKHSLAKVLDEYNFVKFTKRDTRVWKREYQL